MSSRKSSHTPALAQPHVPLAGGRDWNQRSALVLPSQSSDALALAGRKHEFMLLYLNKQTWLGEEGAKLAIEVEAARQVRHAYRPSRHKCGASGRP